MNIYGLSNPIHHKQHKFQSFSKAIKLHLNHAFTSARQHEQDTDRLDEKSPYFTLPEDSWKLVDLNGLPDLTNEYLQCISIKILPAFWQDFMYTIDANRVGEKKPPLFQHSWSAATGPCCAVLEIFIQTIKMGNVPWLSRGCNSQPTFAFKNKKKP